MKFNGLWLLITCIVIFGLAKALWLFFSVMLNEDMKEQYIQDLERRLGRR